MQGAVAAVVLGSQVSTLIPVEVWTVRSAGQ